MGSSSGGFSKECAQLKDTDAVVVVDMQNCFMEARALSGEQATYEIDDEVVNGTLGAGRLWVTDSAAIVSVANAWLDLAEASRASVVATLDWHPEYHCSFCYKTEDGTNVDVGSACISGLSLIHI